MTQNLNDELKLSSENDENEKLSDGLLRSISNTYRGNMSVDRRSLENEGHKNNFSRLISNRDNFTYIDTDQSDKDEDHENEHEKQEDNKAKHLEKGIFDRK